LVAESRDWLANVRLVVALLALLWAIEGLNTLTGHAFNVFGIYPRRLESLPGILLWPFLHGHLHHLLMNTMPFLILGSLVALRGPWVFVKTSVLILLLSGTCVWLFGRSAFHIGASGLVFGYFGFLVAVGLYERRIVSLAIASVTLFYYGGMIFGVLPVNSFVSWEGHLFGLVAGIVAARTFAARRGPAEESAS
jgi:membrane associated rhomboid family serine protease